MVEEGRDTYADSSQPSAQAGLSTRQLRPKVLF